MKNKIKVTVSGKQKTGKTTLVYLLAKYLIQDDIDVEIESTDDYNRKTDFLYQVANNLGEKIKALKKKSNIVLEEKTVGLDIQSSKKSDEKDIPKDFLGTPIRENQRAIRVHEFSHKKEFKKVTIKEIKTEKSPYSDRQQIKVGILTDGNERIGWTFPERLIVEENFTKNI